MSLRFLTYSLNIYFKHTNIFKCIQQSFIILNGYSFLYFQFIASFTYKFSVTVDIGVFEIIFTQI